MSEENYQLKSLHPLKVASDFSFENKKCNLIASHCGILVTVEEKNLIFFSTKAYEETSINSKLRGDKIIDLKPIITLQLQYKSIWIDFNCDGSLLAVVMVTDTNCAVQIKLYDVSKVINNQIGEMAEFKSYNQSQLNDLQWHPYESKTLSIIIDDTCSLCVVENKTIRCISSKSNSFSISWSPKGKQLSVLIRNPTSGAYFINQYDLTMIEKRSTEINDVRSHFGLTINLIPVDICWISTYNFIIGFRGDVDKEKYKVYTCIFSLKKNKIEPLRDIRSSLDCIQEGISARLYNKHLLEWNSIVLVNNTAENLVLYEINAEDELKSMATYCFPLDCNVVGMCFDFTSDVRLPQGWINSSVVNTVSHPIIFLQLSNGTCFGIYIINNNKTLSKGITKLDITHKNTEEHQDSLKFIAENIKQEKQVINNNPSQTNLFGIKNQNINSLFDKNPTITNSPSASIFGLSNNKPIQSNQSDTAPSIYSQSNASINNFFEKGPNTENLPFNTLQSGSIFNEQSTNIKPKVKSNIINEPFLSDSKLQQQLDSKDFKQEAAVVNVEDLFKKPIKHQSDIDNNSIFSLKPNSLNQDKKEVPSTDKYPQTKYNEDTSSKIDSTLSVIDNERDIVDDILSEPLDMLKKQIHHIQQKTKNRIESSRDLCNSKLLKDVPSMIFTVDTNTNVLNKMLSANEALSKESKILSDDINLTVEFTSRCKINVQDIKKKKKCVPVTPNPLLTKISKNLEESYNGINGRLYELEEALDYIEREKNSKLNKKQKSIVPQTLYKTMSYNAKIIALEQMKIDLLKKHMDSQNLDDNVDFFPILNKSKKKTKDNEMENQLLSLLSNRMVKQLTSDSININKRAVPLQTVYTPQSSGVVQKPSNESKASVGNFIPVNVKIVDRNIYKSPNTDNNKVLLSNQAANAGIEASGDRSSCQTNQKLTAAFLKNANVNLSSGDTFKNTSKTFQLSGGNSSVFGADNNPKENKHQSTANKRTTSSNEVKSPQPLIIKSETSSSISSYSAHKSPTQQNKTHNFTNLVPDIVCNTSTPIILKQESEMNHSSKESNECLPTDTSKISEIKNFNMKPKVISEASSATTSQTNRVFATSTHEKSQSGGLFNLSSSDFKHGNESTSVTTQNKVLFGQMYASLKGNAVNISSYAPVVSSKSQIELSSTPANLVLKSEALNDSSVITTQKSEGLFGSLSTTVTQSGGLFGSISTTTQSAGLFGSSSTAQSGGLFGSSSTTTPQNKGLFASSSTTSPQSGGLFGTPTTATESGGLFGSSSTTTPQSGGLFGSSTTVTQSGGLFGSSSTTTPQSGGLFGSSSTIAPQNEGLFGSLSTTTPQSGGLFGSSSKTTTQSGGLFGSSLSTTPQSGALFGSSSTITPQSGGLFGSTTTATQSGGLFGSSSATAPQNEGLFGSLTKTTPQSGGLFGSSSATAPQNEGLFGSLTKTTPQSGGLFGSSSTTTPQSGGLFGSSSASTSQSGGLFGSSLSTTPQSGGLFGSSSTTTQPDTGLFGSPQNSFLSGLGGEAKSQPSNIFGCNTSQSSSSDFGNLFKRNTESSSIFNNSTNLIQSPTSSLFGSAPKFGNQDTTAQTSGLFSNSIFGSKQTSNEVSFTNFSSNNNNTPMFDDPVNNQFGNASSNPSFTQRRM